LGDGFIYGNIDLQSDADSINVLGGETVFNGVINSFCMPAGGPTALVYDDPAQNACGVGDLTIGDGAGGGGNLHLVIDPVDGPSYAFVNNFVVNDDGTLTLDLPPATGSAPIGTYPQIYADTVTLNGGTLVANISAPNGLYETTFYNNVIDGEDLTGEFDQCIATGIPANSLLLSFGCIYDGLDNVDLGLIRTPFNAVPGLNQNGEQVGEGLECIYNVNLTGGLANMFADLFLFTDQVNYNTALNMLSGSVYANYLNSFPSLGVHYNDLTDHATNCEIPALAGSVLECRASSPIHVWGQLDYQTRKADGDVEAGTSRSKRATGLLGIDANVGGSGIVGIDAGYVNNHVDDHQFNDEARGSGWTAGLYGVWDPGNFFVKGVTTYSSFNGSATRRYKPSRCCRWRERGPRR
jgi:hypothetical protein